MAIYAADSASLADSLSRLADYHRRMRASLDKQDAARIARQRGLRSRARRMLLQRLVALPD